MSAIKVVLTTAGRAALVNADHTGTRTVLVSAIGFSSAIFTPAADLLAMPGEVKRLNTVKGGAVAADTIHVTVSDTSTDVYSVHGFGIYLSDGTLFATYSQPGVIVEKSAQAQVLLAVDVQFADIDATNITFGDTDFALNRATTEVQGVVELATNDEASAGTDIQRAVTPSALKAAIDGRFGSGAPSDFVKGLLNLATVALFRAALGLKSAALKDVGTGNGLDADLLDGQHGAYYLDWANQTNVPATFPPAAHRTDWSTIDNAPSSATRDPSWAEVTGKPATFPPSAHSHVIGDVIGLQGSLDAKANLSGAAFTGNSSVAGNFTSSGPASGFIAGDRAGGQTVGVFYSGNGYTYIFGGPLAAGTNNVSINNATGDTQIRGQMKSATIQCDGMANVTAPLTVMETANGSLGGLQVNTVSSNQYSSCFIAFNKTGMFASNFGIGQDNAWRVGGWSMGAVSYRVVHEGLGGTITLNAALVATGGFQYSDRNLKKDIERRAVQRGLALKLARNFKQWRRIADDVFDVGVVAQWLRRVAPHYVLKTPANSKGKGGSKKRYLAIDKPGLALEASMDNALSIVELSKELAVIRRQLKKLEMRK